MDDNEKSDKLELLKTDVLLRRMTKSKLDYYEEGMALCGKYYSAVLKKMKNSFNEQKLHLENKFQEKDLLIKILKEKVEILKEKSSKKEKNVNSFTETTDICEIDEDTLVDLIEKVCNEDESIAHEFSEMEKENNNEMGKSIGGIHRWSF